MANIDWHDSDALWKFSMETIKVSQLYRDARAKHAHAVKTLKLALAKAYQNKTIERKISEDKAYMILAEKEDLRDALMAQITYENEYKGLEKVLEARQAALSFNQSLIKNQVRNS